MRIGLRTGLVPFCLLLSLGAAGAACPREPDPVEPADINFDAVAVADAVLAWAQCANSLQWTPFVERAEPALVTAQSVSEEDAERGHQQIIATLEARARSGSFVVDSEAYSQCLALPELVASCTRSIDLDEAAARANACYHVLVGTRAEGGGCSSDECQPDLACSRGPGAEPCGVCIPKGSLGDSCADLPCADALRCDSDTDRCVAGFVIVGEGESCVVNLCNDGLDCVLLENGDELCLAPATAGESCAERSCVDGLLCSSSTLVCREVGRGLPCEETCNLSETGLVCVDNVCVDAEVVSEGEACTVFDLAGNIGRYCINQLTLNECVPSEPGSSAGTCRPLPAEGEACSATGRCASGLACNGLSVCEGPLEIGEPCDGEGDLWCDDSIAWCSAQSGQCEPHRSLGEACDVEIGESCDPATSYCDEDEGFCVPLTSPYDADMCPA